MAGSNKLEMYCTLENLIVSMMNMVSTHSANVLSPKDVKGSDGSTEHPAAFLGAAS